MLHFPYVNNNIILMSDTTKLKIHNAFWGVKRYLRVYPWALLDSKDKSYLRIINLLFYFDSMIKITRWFRKSYFSQN